ncbi:MAG: DNA-3-methyladenine glycosylase I [Rhodospirillales bacterium]|nr:DNA-3-methyladenine glycosylase I [Rhodospirillales bacterium]
MGDGRTRCTWAGSERIYIDYHDQEWGVPEWDERRLFEMLILEGAQAGLAWITILRKRENYRVAFDGFDPEIVARYGPEKRAALKADAGIVRNRAKIEAAVGNAKAWLELRGQNGGPIDFLWGFVDGKPIANRWRSLADVPAETAESKAMSKALKANGFRFVGPTICYAFMQAVGMVNDHTLDCFRHDQV